MTVKVIPLGLVCEIPHRLHKPFHMSSGLNGCLATQYSVPQIINQQLHSIYIYHIHIGRSRFRCTSFHVNHQHNIDNIIQRIRQTDIATSFSAGSFAYSCEITCQCQAWANPSELYTGNVKSTQV